MMAAARETVEHWEGVPFMRKEVKLGMTLGGGAAALLVGYLLVAPPANNNKKGAQFAGGGSGSIIDNSQPGDLTAGGSDAAGGGGGAKTDAAQAAPANNGAAAGTVEQPQAKSGEAAGGGGGTVEPKSAGKGAAAADPWTLLNSGKQPKAGSGRDAQAGQSGQSHEKASAGAADNRLAARGGANKVEAAAAPAGGEGRAATARPRDEGNLHFNPKAAWGDGLSTDGARLAGANALGHGGGGGGARASVSGDASADEPKAGGTHLVKSGETFSSIAAVVYGSASYYPHLVRANPHANPNNLKLGTVITIPPIDQVKASGTGKEAEHATAAATGAPNVPQESKLDPVRQYRVQPGDSLYKISMKVYGKSGYTDRIYEANKNVIGPNPTKLKVGMVLELPDKAGTIASNTETPTGTGPADTEVK
jgi:nucleoid-associated protein YgaU